jgi:MFS family permease
MAAPKTPWTFYAFAVAVGFTWLATLPVTANVVTHLFGTRYLATLFGLTLFSHQLGSFFGAWLGGVAVTALGDYTWMFWADVALAVLATVVHLPIREGPVEFRRQPA